MPAMQAQIKYSSPPVPPKSSCCVAVLCFSIHLLPVIILGLFIMNTKLPKLSEVTWVLHRKWSDILL